MIPQKTFNPTHPTNEPSLSRDQVTDAKVKLVKCTSEFPSINRRFVDPPVAGEPKFALFSYIAYPDLEMDKFLGSIKDTLKPKHKKQLVELQARPQLIKGVGKIRGAYQTQSEAEIRAEDIVRDIDSTNSVFTCIVGVPFPLVAEGMAEELSTIDLQQQTEHTIAQNVRKQRQKDQKEMEDIKRREDELMATAKKDSSVDDEDEYVTQRVKLAHLRYSIVEHVKKHALCVENEKQCVAKLLDMKNRNPEFEEKYMEKYLAGRKAAHIPDDHNLEGFMKYMNDPLVKLEDVKEEWLDMVS